MRMEKDAAAPENLKMHLMVFNCTQDATKSIYYWSATMAIMTENYLIRNLKS